LGKVGISLEASSWRGAFIAGVLDVFGRRGIYPDLVSGSSSGACNGAAYVSRQFDILTDNWIHLAAEPMIDLRREARRANAGSIFNMSRIYNRALDRGLTRETVRNLAASPVEFLVICTRLANGSSASD
jgi:predicted patatin/cPLA2 family phospholipase